MATDLINVHIDGIVFAEIPLGGIARMWTNIINRLPDYGCKVHLYLPKITRTTTQFDERVELIDYPTTYRLRPGRLFNPLTYKHYQSRLNQMWAGPGKGVFHSTHFTTNTHLRIPQVVTVHDLFHERLPHCFTEAQKHPFCERRRDCINVADAVVCVSDATAKDLNLVYGEKVTISRVIWQAVDPIFGRLTNAGEHQSSTFDNHMPYILYVGTRFPYKNFNGLLAGYAAWEGSSHYKLLIVGRPATAEEQAFIHALGLSQNVIFCPPVADSELVLAYNQSSAFVMPSLSEGFGLPLWEAMACGVPVVSSRGGSLPEIGGETPVYFDFGPPANIAAALQEAVAIPRGSKRLLEGQQRASTRTWDDVTQDYVCVYRELLQSKSH